MKALILVPTFFCIIIAFSHLGNATRTLMAQPKVNLKESSTLNQTQQHNHIKRVGDCTYLITIRTSCVSPPNTKDQIDIQFGDAYGTEIYFRRLDKFSVFEPCSTTKIKLAGECINKICRVLVTRKGGDGWIPEKVILYDYNHSPITFSNDSGILDDGHGYGANFCFD